MTDAVKDYFAQFGSDDSDSDDDEGYVPEPKKKGKSDKKQENEISNQAENQPKAEQKTEEQQVQKVEEVKPTENQPEPQQQTNTNPPQPTQPQTTTETNTTTTEHPQQPHDMVPSLDNDYYQPVRERTAEEKEQSNKLINDYFAKLLGSDDDEEEDIEDAEYTKLKINKKKEKKQDEAEKQTAPATEESDTEPIHPEDIYGPIEKLIAEVGDFGNAHEALASGLPDAQLINITNAATRLLFLGFADIYEKPIAELKTILADLKTKLGL